MRANWRDWLGLTLIAVGCLLAIVFFEGFTQLLFAGLLGAALAVAGVGWLIGGDVYSLPWLWGALGEQMTAEVLAG